ncbi:MULTISPECIES: pyridoxal-dependent decarboxylase [unclassified Wenzhouxiangella]|uniref:pyridoxal phosphate-dependent decarboxylase family protein n=1 Tax=unclassified Wenzhouxiangella TaxID=2613841 RepID=UPI000E32D216|nr:MULTISPECIES: pyridoxal-dependent decarboxylase [unclassified Wenzhouxiangella]RFF27364.1 pyridoxal-dependent decarboxylase [Wenzhouxiangella sp. 15181]RFP68792.1 pyridoxal-dependent decarboxylase [Wenzhouxiangella sp. 15190]
MNMRRQEEDELVDWLSPLFLGSYAENNELLEKVLVELLRDHVYWRRNIHPEDRPQIPVLADTGPEYRRFVGRMKTELHGLTARLKNSAPFFNPRYIGHMASDLLLPGLIAQLVTTLYNPNHVTDEASPVTLPLELELGRQLAAMFGFNTDPEQEPCAWGHATSGGTIANDESLWYFRAVRYWPLAAAIALREAGFDPGALKHGPEDFVHAPDHVLFNLSVDHVIRLRREVLASIDHQLDRRQARDLARRIESERVEYLGMAEFHLRHPELGTPVVLVADTAHYSWEKALKLLGLGAANLEPVAVNERMRLDSKALDDALARLADERRPVLAVVGILGTTEFGSIDPVHEIVAARQRWRREGMEFAIHVDAAWGGYLASMFHRPDGTLLDHAEMRRRFHLFPSEPVYKAFAALRHVDSVTVDPHKLGYVPFGCGAYVARNRGMTDFISQKAAYVFDDAETVPDSEYERRFRNLGQYILEGSKPGAAAAGAWLSHRVLPLDADNFGRLCAETIRNCEYFFEHIDQLRDELAGVARVVLPFEPDTNLVCLAINPSGNRSLARMNAFGRRLYEHLSVGEEVDIHSREFFGSRTVVHRHKLGERAAERLMAELDLDPSTFVDEPDDSGEQADSIFLLRHTLMNPWLSGHDEGMNYLDRYCRHLAELVRQAMRDQPG